LSNMCHTYSRCAWTRQRAWPPVRSAERLERVWAACPEESTLVENVWQLGGVISRLPEHGACLDSDWGAGDDARGLLTWWYTTTKPLDNRWWTSGLTVHLSQHRILWARYLHHANQGRMVHVVLQCRQKMNYISSQELKIQGEIIKWKEQFGEVLISQHFSNAAIGRCRDHCTEDSEHHSLQSAGEDGPDNVTGLRVGTKCMVSTCW